MNSKTKTVRLSLRLTKDQLMRYYAGNVKQVVAKDLRGKVIRFPVNILQPYVTHDGISGLFSICFDQTGRFVSIEREGY